MGKIKVVHLNTSGIGGAAIACHRLHHLMCDANLDSKVIHLYDNYPNDINYSSIKYTFRRRFINRLLYTIVQKDLKPEAYVFSEMAPLASGIAKHPLILNADVIYLHWIQGGFLSFADIKSIAELGKPVFCFAHDMWWITGGCHYTFNCEQYKTGCNNCQMHRYFKKIYTHRQLEKKKVLYEQYSNIHFIAPSNWMKECINQSFALSNHRCDVIPNVVPEKDFKYIDKYIARDYFSLPHDKIIISFGTADNKNKVKGISYLIDALKHIKNDNLLLCVYGSEYDDYLVRQLSSSIRFLGRLSKASEVAMASAASDLFISPTLAESFGLTLLENIKCGTPVVSCNVTAVPEIVHDHKNGYLVDPKNSNQIANAIQDFIDNPIVLDGSFDKVFKDEIILNKHIESIKRVLNR